MSRADELKALHAAELAVVELEDQLVAAKAGGEDLAEVKANLRQARQHYRELRTVEDVDPDAAVAHPDTVNTSARTLGTGAGDQ